MRPPDGGGLHGIVEVDLAAGIAVFTIAAHADAAGMGIERLDLGVELGLQGDQISAALLVECSVAEIDPLAGYDTLDGMVIQPALSGTIKKLLTVLGAASGSSSTTMRAPLAIQNVAMGFIEYSSLSGFCL